MRVKTTKLSTIALAISLIAFPLNSPPVLSATDQSASAGTSETVKGLGLKSEQLHLVNQGRFTELADQLSTRVSAGNAKGRELAWLAFAYMYSQKCDPLKQFIASYNGSTETHTNETKQGALSITTVIKERFPSDVDDILMRAFLLLCEKKNAEAEKELQTIPASAMNDALVNYAFATLSGKQGKPQIAIGYSKRAVELAPDFAWGYRTIGFLQERWLNEPQEAIKNYKQALAIEPKLYEVAGFLINLYLANNNYDEAIDVARDVIKHDSKNAFNYYRLADIYLRQWRVQEAAVQLRKAISLDPSNTEYHHILALILQRQGNLEGAITEQKRVVENSKNKSNDLVDLANLQIAADKQQDAINSLNEALDIDPGNMNAAGLLTNLSVQMKEFDQLTATLNKCANKSPKNEAVRLHLGDAYVAAGKLDQAIEAYKEAANLNTNDPEPHTRIAAILASKKDYEGAAKAYTRSLNINSNSVPNLVALGGCEAELDDYLKAEAAFVTALALHQLTLPADSTAPPTRIQIIRGLAALLFREGRYADAAAQFVSLCEMDREPSTKSLNHFMYAQSVALRDLSKDSFKQLDEAYANLPDDQKVSQEINYIDTLLRAKHYGQALSLLKQLIEHNVCEYTKMTTIVDQSSHWLKDPFYYICLSRAYAGQGDSAKAEVAALRAIDTCDKDNSPHSDAYCQLGDVLLAKGDLDGAEKNANAAIGINGKGFRAYVLLGQIAMKRHKPDILSYAVIKDGQLKLATEAANKAIEIDPYLIDAYLLLGNAQVAQDDSKGALTTYRKAVDLYPGLLAAHESLLTVLKKIGTEDEISKEQKVIDQIRSKQ